MNHRNAGKWLKPVALLLLMPLLLVVLHHVPVAPGSKAWLATLGGLAVCVVALVQNNPWFKASMFASLLVNVLCLALLGKRDGLQPWLDLVYRFVWL